MNNYAVCMLILCSLIAEFENHYQFQMKIISLSYENFCSKIRIENKPKFKSHGIRTSIFIDAKPEMAVAAAQCGADRVELYTEPYADLYPTDPEKAIAPFIETAKAAKDAGLGLNAGHDLNLQNLEYFIRNIPWTDEVSIGHAVISDALYMGLEKTIHEYLSKVKIF